jgi:sugar lactone lactonase YvrE
VALFNGPEGIVWTPNGLVVSEPAANDLRLLQLASGANVTDPSSWNVSLLAGPGTAGLTNGTGAVAQFNEPLGLGLAAGGGVLVADFGNNAVRNVALPATTFLSGNTGGAGSTDQVQLNNGSGVIPSCGLGTNLPYIAYAGSLAAGASTAPQPWNFLVPQGVTAFTFTVMVEAGTAIQAPPESVSNTSGSGGGSPNVQVRTLAGSYEQAGFFDGLASAARFNGPNDVAVDSAGNVFVADWNNNAVRRIATNGLVSTVAGTASGGFTDGTGNVATFINPSGVAVNPAGTVVYVTDIGNQRIRRLALAPYADPTNAVNWTVTTIAGTGTAGHASGLGSVATMDAPWGVCLDAGGTLYFTEYTGNRVRRLGFRAGDPSVASNWLVTPMAGDDSAAAGTAAATNGSGSAARFDEPEGVATDKAGNVYIADIGNNLVRRMTPDGTVSTFAGSTAGYLDATTGTSAKFAGPTSVGVDSAGFVYVTDEGNQRIRRISPTSPYAVTTVAGTGSTGHADGSGAVATFDQPWGIAVDQGGTLYVADYSGDTVRLIERVVSVGSN